MNHEKVMKKTWNSNKKTLDTGIRRHDSTEAVFTQLPSPRSQHKS